MTGGRTVAWQLAFGAILLAGWEILGRFGAGSIISRPSLIALRLENWFAGPIYPHLLTTLFELVVGMAIGCSLGIFFGLILGRMPVLAALLQPVIVAMYSVPLVALAPLFIMFFGLGALPKIVLVALVTFFLLFFHSFAGARRIDQDQVDALAVMGATRLEIFRKVVAPATTVWIIGGLKVALPYALVATVTGELLATRAGLGFLLSQASERYDMASLYGVLFILMVMGLLLSEISTRAENFLLRWRHAGD
jgi:NitT/TauT family transport system permease protein